MAETEIILLVLFITAAMVQFFVLFFVIMLFRKRQVWAFIRAGLKGNGTILFKSHYNGGITTEFSQVPTKEVLWKIKDKTTHKTRELTTFLGKTYHYLAGSAISVHFCPITYPHNINLNTKEKAILDVEKINAKMTSRYTLGLYDALQMRRVAGLDLQQIEMILLIIIIIIMLSLIHI